VNFFKSRSNVHTTHGVVRPERSLQAHRPAAGPTGGLRGRRVAPPARQRSGRGRGHGGAALGQRQAPAGWRGPPAALVSLKPIKERSRKVLCNHSWNHSCCECFRPSARRALSGRSELAR
jgi:hypothetical protein